MYFPRRVARLCAGGGARPPEKFDRPFPETVAINEYRKAFLAYGVSGTPTFVLLDGTGKVRSYATGYSADKGLGIAGWSWTKPAPAGG